MWILSQNHAKNTQNQVVWRIRIRKVRFAKLILHREFEIFVDICIHLSHPFFCSIRIRKLNLVNLDLVPRSCKYAVNQVVERIRIPKCKNTQNQVVWRIRIRKVRFPKLILHRGFCRHLYTFASSFFWRIRIRKLNLDLVPRSCKFPVNQVVWRIRVPKLNLDLVPKSCKYAANQLVWRIEIAKLHLDLVPKSCEHVVNQVVGG